MKMSETGEEVQDADALRQALKEARAEVETVRREMARASAKQEKLLRTHEEALDRVRQAGDREVIAAELRAEAIRYGAHNPEDVVRLIDASDVVRDADGRVQGVAEAVERARKDRAYLFGEMSRAGVATGTTAGRSAPRPGGDEPFDARRANGADYEARKWQFLAQG